MMMYEKHKAYKIYLNVGKSIVKIDDITEDDRVLYDSINNCHYIDIDMMVRKLGDVINEHAAQMPYKIIKKPIGYGK